MGCHSHLSVAMGDYFSHRLLVCSQVTSGLVDVAEVMDTWTRQKGYPVVRVVLSPDGQLALSQRRFRLVPSRSDVASEPTPDLGYRWFVPLSLRTDSPGTHLFWMNRTDGGCCCPVFLDHRGTSSRRSKTGSI